MTVELANALANDSYIQSLDLREYPEIANVIGGMYKELYIEIDADKRRT